MPAVGCYGNCGTPNPFYCPTQCVTVLNAAYNVSQYIPNPHQCNVKQEQCPAYCPCQYIIEEYFYTRGELPASFYGPTPYPTEQCALNAGLEQVTSGAGLNAFGITNPNYHPTEYFCNPCYSPCAEIKNTAYCNKQYVTEPNPRYCPNKYISTPAKSQAMSYGGSGCIGGCYGVGCFSSPCGAVGWAFGQLGEGINCLSNTIQGGFCQVFSGFSSGGVCPLCWGVSSCQNSYSFSCYNTYQNGLGVACYCFGLCNSLSGLGGLSNPGWCAWGGCSLPCVNGNFGITLQCPANCPYWNTVWCCLLNSAGNTSGNIPTHYAQTAPMYCTGSGKLNIGNQGYYLANHNPSGSPTGQTYEPCGSKVTSYSCGRIVATGLCGLSETWKPASPLCDIRHGASSVIGSLSGGFQNASSAVGGGFVTFMNDVGAFFTSPTFIILLVVALVGIGIAVHLMRSHGPKGMPIMPIPV